MKYFLYQLIRLTALLLPLKFAYWVGKLFADMRYFCFPTLRETVENNMRQISDGVSQEEVKKRARKVFQGFAKYIVDFSRSSSLNRDNLSKSIVLKGTENIERALAKEKGIIFITAHLGSWELGGVALAILGYPINVVALDHKEASVNRLFVRQRANQGVRVIHFGMAARKCYQALRRNEMVALLGDWDIRSHGDKVSFFGRETTLPRGPAILSLRTGAAIVPVFVVREEDEHSVMFFEAPIFPDASLGKERGEAALMQKVSNVLEKTIQRYPEQWFLFHRIWPEN